MISAPEREANWQHQYAVVNGVRLHYVEVGSGPLVLLLHGFPEFWYSWRHQIPALAEAGFHVIAPDLRGYNLSEKPTGVSAYRLDMLLDDVVGLIHHAGEDKATIVGHDWGGVLAWHLAMHHPQVVEKLIILNAPHPAAYQRELHSWEQLRKSWYILFFQVPGLPEQVLGAGDFDALDRMLRRKPVHNEAFSPEDVRLYKQALSRPGALTAALNYYRALHYGKERGAFDTAAISMPTLLLWGEQDSYLTSRLTEGLNDWVSDLRVVRFPDASHFVQNDVPERVNRLMIDFLRGLPVPRVEPSARTGNVPQRESETLPTSQLRSERELLSSGIMS